MSDCSSPVSAAASCPPVFVSAPTTSRDASRLHRDAVHLIPCHIDHDGPAPVSTSFLPQPFAPVPSSIGEPTPRPTLPPSHQGQQQQQQLLTAAFRGRGLLGSRIDLADKGFAGVVMAPGPASSSSSSAAVAGSSAGSGSSAHVAGLFGEFTAWGKDGSVADIAYIHRAIGEYVPVAAAFHETD